MRKPYIQGVSKICVLTSGNDSGHQNQENNVRNSLVIPVGHFVLFPKIMKT